MHSNTDSWLILLSKDGTTTKVKSAFGRQNHCAEVSTSKYKVFGVLECSVKHGIMNYFWEGTMLDWKWISFWIGVRHPFLAWILIPVVWSKTCYPRRSRWQSRGTWSSSHPMNTAKIHLISKKMPWLVIKCPP